MGQVIVNPLAETYWLLDEEDMLKNGRELVEWLVVVESGE